MSNPEFFRRQPELKEDFVDPDRKFNKEKFDSEKLKQQGLHPKEVDLMRVAMKNKSPESAIREVWLQFTSWLEDKNPELLEKIKNHYDAKQEEWEVLPQQVEDDNRKARFVA